MRKMKDSGNSIVGEMPFYWTQKRLKYLCEITTGNEDTQNADPDGEYPFYVRSPIVERCPRYTFDGEGILVAGDGAGAGRVFHHAYGRYAVHQRVYRLYDFKFNSDYVFYFLSNMFPHVMDMGSAQSTVPSMRLPMLMNFPILIPAKEEAKRIVDFLDRKCAEIDALTADVQKEIETLQEYRRSLITEAVTKGLDPDAELKDSGNVYLGQINSQWEAKRIKYLFFIRKDIAGYEGPTVLSITQKGIRPKNLAYGEGQQAADYSGYQLVSPGDFAMNHMDLLTGWVDISNQAGVTSPDYRVFRIRDTARNNRRFFLYVMQMCYTNRIFYQLGHGVSGMGRWRLPTDRFLNFIIPVPSTSEQQRIAAFLDDKCAEIDSIVETKQKQLDALAEYRKSLIYEYVTGKKEVV